MEPLQTDSVLPLGASQSEQNKRRKQRGIMGVVVFTVKQPALLNLSTFKKSQSRVVFRHFIAAVFRILSPHPQ